MALHSTPLGSDKLVYIYIYIYIFYHVITYVLPLHYFANSYLC